MSTDPGMILLVLGSMVCIFFSIIVWAEQERFPFQYLKWTPYIDSYGDKVRVGIRRKGERVILFELFPMEDSFDNDLAEARAEARVKCVQLNATQKGLMKRLPK